MTMLDISDEPVHFHLHGISGGVEKSQVGHVGLRLMNEMWQEVKSSGILTTGTNHWVYLPDGKLFVGVELRNPQDVPTSSPLEPLEFELRRSLKHIHVGSYQGLPQKWEQLKAELAVRGERIASPSMEIYGHHCDDPEKAETTILIALHARDEERRDP